MNILKNAVKMLLITDRKIGCQFNDVRDVDNARIIIIVAIDILREIRNNPYYLESSLFNIKINHTANELAIYFTVFTTVLIYVLSQRNI